MKTLSFNIVNKLAHILFFRSAENTEPANKKAVTKSNEAELNPGNESERNTKHQSSLAGERKIYTGNFFAGAHCIFNPRLL